MRTAQPCAAFLLQTKTPTWRSPYAQVHCCNMSLCEMSITEMQISIQRSSGWATNYLFPCCIIIQLCTSANSRWSYIIKQTSHIINMSQLNCQTGPVPDVEATLLFSKVEEFSPSRSFECLRPLTFLRL